MIAVANTPIVEHVGGILAIGSASGKDYTDSLSLHRTRFGGPLVTKLLARCS